MGVHLTKDEKNYIDSITAESYLLLKHEPLGGIDCFSVYDQNEYKHYSINMRGWYRKKGENSPTLEISDENGSVVGTMRWNNEHPASSPFIVRCYDNNGNIEIQYEQNKRFFRKSWYKPSFSIWTLDYHTVYCDYKQICAEIDSISNYKKNLRGVKELRDSYLIKRYYNTLNNANDVLVLLFWAIVYICNDYKSIHENSRASYIQKNKLETKLDGTIENAKDSLNDTFKNAKNSFDDRKKAIEDRQEDVIEEMHNRARSYENDKQQRLQDKIDSKTKRQRILSIVLKVLICLVAPVVGLFVTAIIEQYTAIRIDFYFVAAAFFIAAILIVNRDKPEWVIFYEWIKLILFCLFGLIACLFIEAVIEHLLGTAGIKGIDIGISLILFVIAGICKWMSRHIDVLVSVKSVFSIMQFVSLGLLLGQIHFQFVDQSRILPTIVGVAAIVAVIVLSKAKILVRKNVKHCIFGVGVGIVVVSFVVPVINTILETFISNH